MGGAMEIYCNYYIISPRVSIKAIIIICVSVESWLRSVLFSQSYFRCTSVFINKAHVHFNNPQTETRPTKIFVIKL